MIFLLSVLHLSSVHTVLLIPVQAQMIPVQAQQMPGSTSQQQSAACSTALLGQMCQMPARHVQVQQRA